MTPQEFFRQLTREFERLTHLFPSLPFQPRAADILEVLETADLCVLFLIWSPDGMTVTFGSESERVVWTIQVLNAETATLQLLEVRHPQDPEHPVVVVQGERVEPILRTVLNVLVQCQENEWFSRSKPIGGEQAENFMGTLFEAVNDARRA